MPTTKDERDRILSMIESGQVSADQGAQLLDALDIEQEQRPVERLRERILRIRVTGLNPRQPKVHFVAALPVNLVRAGLRLGGQLLPQLSNSTLEDLLQNIETRTAGRLLDVQDLEKGERLEIFVE